MQRGGTGLIDATSRAFSRMAGMLFRPFDLGRWLVLGFTAWLATLMEGGFSFHAGGPDITVPAGEGEEIVEELSEFFRDLWERAGDYGPWILWGAAAVAVFLLIVAVALLWVRSRGKFVFLDNVVHGRALVVAPWKRFGRLGNSLFLWTLGLAAVSSLAMAGLAAAVVFLLWRGFAGDGWTGGIIAALAAAVFAGALLALVLGYVWTMLEHFVVPLMYRHSLPAGAAWRRLGGLHRADPGGFVLYFLWLILLSLGVAVAVLVFSCATCCVGAVLLSLPYIGAVALLPATVFLRSLGPEFLRGYGADCDLWAAASEGAPPPMPPPAGS